MQTTSDIKNLTNVNIGILQKIEDCEGGVIFYSSKYGNCLFWKLFSDISR
jgi:hypothetical protein